MCGSNTLHPVPFELGYNSIGLALKRESEMSPADHCMDVFKTGFGSDMLQDVPDSRVCAAKEQHGAVTGMQEQRGIIVDEVLTETCPGLDQKAGIRFVYHRAGDLAGEPDSIQYFGKRIQENKSSPARGAVFGFLRHADLTGHNIRIMLYEM